MPTDKLMLRTVDQVMNDYTPIYRPIYPLFLAGKSQQYAREVGKTDFRRVEAVSDIRAKRITPKDTEMETIAVVEGVKSYRRYFYANKFIQSNLQSTEGNEEVIAQVLDEHQLQADEIFLFGEGTNNATVKNNGLFFSLDANFVEPASVEVALSNRLYDLHAKMVETAEIARLVAGQKIVMVYGDETTRQVNSLYETAAKAFKGALAEVLGPEFSMIVLPKRATPSGAEGWLVANMDQIKTHYSVLPQLLAQGVNEEDMYSWHNFMIGSMMVEVLAKYGIVKQACTYETE